MLIHKTLKVLRGEKNMTQCYIAHKINISQNAYSLIENGKTKIDEQRIIQLAKILDVHPLELFTGDTNRAAIKVADKAMLRDIATPHNSIEGNLELTKLLFAQLAQKDQQIEKLLKQLERISAVLDLSQKIDLLIYYK